MIFPDQLTDMGIIAPKEHQRVISKLTTGLGTFYYQQRKIALEPLPETMLDEGQPARDKPVRFLMCFCMTIKTILHPSSLK